MATTISQVGPFETEREARETAMMEASNRDMLMAACTAAGVELGAWDRRILEWLAGYEGSTCAVIAGLLTRANRDGDQ